MLGKNDCWLIGDRFLNNSFSYLQESAAIDNIHNLPYLYKKYEVHHFMMSPLCNDPPIARLRNCLVQGLDGIKRVPKLIILFLDEEILKMTHYTGDRALKWLFHEFYCCISATKDTLPSKCLTKREPHIITIKPLPIPDSNDPNQHHLQEKRKVNKILEKTIRSYNNCSTLNCNTILSTDTNYFQSNGKLTPQGHKAFRAYINYALQNRDRLMSMNPTQRRICNPT